MKAGVQYNDYVGTAAADEEFGMNLKDLLTERKVDLDKYKPIGISFYSGSRNFFSVSIQCIDKENSNEKHPYIVSLSFEKNLTMQEFFDLFKRFNVVLVSRNNLGYEDHEIDEEIHI